MNSQRVDPPSSIKSIPNVPEEDMYDPIQVTNVLFEQIHRLQREIDGVWSKFTQVLYLDPHTLEGILRRRYERQVSQYYSQMVVEYRYEEDIED